MDDGSEDGSRDWLRESCLLLEQAFHDEEIDCEVVFVTPPEHFGSPPALMNYYLKTIGRPQIGRYPLHETLFAKVDNDIAMPKGWLEAGLQVMESADRPDLLGYAAGWTNVTDGPVGWRSSSHIGGVGLMRRDAFHRLPEVGADGRQGFTQWQHRWIEADELRAGWIIPDVQAVQLDLIPEEPWASWAAGYVEKGWARHWPPYGDERLWRWVTEQAVIL